MQLLGCASPMHLKLSDIKQFLNFAILNNSLLSTDQTVLLTPVRLLATCFCKPSTSCERQENAAVPFPPHRTVISRELGAA